MSKPVSKPLRLMQFYHERQKSLEEIQLLLGRKMPTLKGYARRLGLAFKDYTPRALREKEK